MQSNHWQVRKLITSDHLKFGGKELQAWIEDVVQCHHSLGVYPVII